MSDDPGVVIHIGWHKTASTYLQNGFFRQIGANFQPLAAFPEGVRAPEGIESLIELVESRDAFSAGLLRKAVLPPSGDSPALTVISHEEISGHPHGYAMIDPFVAARNLAAAFPRARIVAVIRNQFDYILSLYAYRVAVRGHEYRSLSRFLEEDGAAGLLRHLQYDRLIQEYVRLFGAANVLVLPLDMLRSDPGTFFVKLSDFMGVPNASAPDSRPANTGTRQAMLLVLLRPLNWLFSQWLALLLLATGRWPPAYAASKRKIFPFLSLRYRYYAFKRRLTALVNERFPNARRIGMQDVPGREELGEMFSAANARLQELGVIDWDMEANGFTLPTRKQDDHFPQA